MANYYAVVQSPDYLMHYGILGMKWGVRRFQNPDGSLTEEGRRRYGDVLTKDQMKNIVRSYNLRTGSNKTINKNTTFKTRDGKVYDYKGRRIETETDVADPKNESEKREREKKESEAKKTETDKSKKDIKNMTDQELRDLNNRMQAEIDYKDKYSKLNPRKISVAEQVITNLRNSLVKDIPAAFSAVSAEYLKKMLLAKDDKPERTNTNINPRTASDSELKAANDRMKWEETFSKYKNGTMKDVNNSLSEDDVENIVNRILKDKE